MGKNAKKSEHDYQISCQICLPYINFSLYIKLIFNKETNYEKKTL
jgi:hypothetical protein